MAGVQRYHREVLAPRGAGAAARPVVPDRGRVRGRRLEIASQCDLRIAGASARFGVPINRLGFPMAPDEMRGLIALAGRAAALAILLEGRVFGADEARGLGLLTRVVDDAQVATEARRSAERIAQGAPLAARINSACRAGWPKAAR